MPSISFGTVDPWVARKSSFRELLERTRKKVGSDADVYAVDQAMALDGLHLEMMTRDQALRLAAAVCDAAMEWRNELEARRSKSVLDQERVEHLRLLERQLRETMARRS